MINKRLVALDTNALLELFLLQNSDHARDVKAVIEDENNQIVIPAVVGVELVCTRSMRGDNVAAPPPYQSSAIKKAQAFLRGSDFFIAELDRKSMLLAGEIGTEYGLKPPDACVLATAIEYRCSVLYTYDKGLLKVNSREGRIEIGVPPSPSTLF